MTETVPRVVAGLMALRGSDPRVVAAHLRIAPSSFSERMSRKRRFTVAEIADLADFFGVSPAVFFEDPTTLIEGTIPTDTRSGSSVDPLLLAAVGF